MRVRALVNLLGEDSEVEMPFSSFGEWRLVKTVCIEASKQADVETSWPMSGDRSSTPTWGSGHRLHETRCLVLSICSNKPRFHFYTNGFNQNGVYQNKQRSTSDRGTLTRENNQSSSRGQATLGQGGKCSKFLLHFLPPQGSSLSQ